MKILVSPASSHYFTDKAGSVYSISYNLLSSLSAFDLKLYSIVNNVDPSTKIPQKTNLLSTGSFVKFGSKANKWSDVTFILKSFGYAKKIIKDEGIDIIHHMTPFLYGTSFNLLAISHKLDNYPFIIGPAEVPHLLLYDEYMYLRGKKHPLIKLEYYLAKCLIKIIKLGLNRPLSLKTLNNCDMLIAVNNKTREEYRKKIMTDKKICVIPLGVDLKKFEFSSHSLNHAILTVGLHIKRKGFDYLINAMPKILKEYPDAKLHIASNGPQTSNLKMLVDRLNLNKAVIFHGRVNDEKLLRLYEHCRVFCHPSISEGFCHTTLEAMATGRPVVSTNTVGSEMVEDGKTGFLVPVGDSDAIADAILKIFGDDELTYKMGAEARKKAEREYDWNVIAKKYYEVYLEAMDNID